MFTSRKEIYLPMKLTLLTGLLIIVTFIGTGIVQAKLFDSDDSKYDLVESKKRDLVNITDAFVIAILAEKPSQEQLGQHFKALATSLREYETSFNAPNEVHLAPDKIHTAIDEYMQNNGYDRSNQVTQALDVYSRYFTETLIAQANTSSQSKPSY